MEELFDKGVGADCSNHEPVRPVTTEDIDIQCNKITNWVVCDDSKLLVLNCRFTYAYKEWN